MIECVDICRREPNVEASQKHVGQEVRSCSNVWGPRDQFGDIGSKDRASRKTWITILGQTGTLLLPPALTAAPAKLRHSRGVPSIAPGRKGQQL